jgi:hypothetical protein
MPAFQKFAAEARIIGNLLTGYTDLEVSLFHCVHVVRDDFDAVLKAMFRARGEETRVNIADGLGLSGYKALGLGEEFADAITAMKYCVRIRNQFAHSVLWDDNSGRLAIAALEDAAKLDEAMSDLSEPAPRRPGSIETVGALRDDALKPQATRLVEDRDGIRLGEV